MFGLGAITGSNAAAFDPDQDIPSLSGKVILVTGGSSGLGKQSAIFLARRGPLQMWITARTETEANNASEEIRKEAPGANVKYLAFDLGSFESINKAAAEFLTKAIRLDVLVLNAGVMGIPSARTESGYEIQFGINYMGHAYLTKLLLPLINRTADEAGDARVITLTSYSHWNAPEGGIDFDLIKTTAEQLPSLKRYAQSKLANILFARQLAKEHSKITTAAIHPGAADTALQSGATDIGLIDWASGTLLNKALLYQPLEVVARNQVWAATTSELASGEYYVPLGLVGARRPEAADDELASRLWKWTEEEFRVWQQGYSKS